MKNTRAKAFTLIEMMAVVVIIAILAAVVAPKFFGQVGKAQQVTAKADIQKIKQAISLYKLDTGRFPDELHDLSSQPEDAKNWHGPYLEKKLKDPWHNDYQYRAPGQNGREFDIWSYGQDEKEGGEGESADVTSWEEDD